jgi:ABC-type Zn2+ transport system substrate-binding protein/surface adhesin
LAVQIAKLVRKFSSSSRRSNDDDDNDIDDDDDDDVDEDTDESDDNASDADQQHASNRVMAWSRFDHAASARHVSLGERLRTPSKGVVEVACDFNCKHLVDQLLADIRSSIDSFWFVV